MKFIESICFKDGAYIHLDYHQERMNKTVAHFFQKEAVQLNAILPQLGAKGTFKVRFTYDENTYTVEHSFYEKKELSTLALIDAPPIDYAFKYEDRSKINELVRASPTNDVILCIKDFITDSSYANLAFWDGTNWITPEHPLLEGVKRAVLLARGELKKAPIRKSDVAGFEKVSLINAMLDLGDLEISVPKILHL